MRTIKLLGGLWLVFVVIVLSTGCGILKPAKKVDGYYIEHYLSCGPAAMHYALTHFIDQYNVPINVPDRVSISQRIQDDASILNLRFPLTLVHSDFVQITWPSEMESVCKSYGFDLIKLKSLDDLKETDTGLVLLHKRGTLEYHWVCHPVDSQIKTHYGSTLTAIHTVYRMRWNRCGTN
jgi:hypothetical protein